MKITEKKYYIDQFQRQKMTLRGLGMLLNQYLIKENVIECRMDLYIIIRQLMIHVRSLTDFMITLPILAQRWNQTFLNAI